MTMVFLNFEILQAQEGGVEGGEDVQEEGKIETIEWERFCVFSLKDYDFYRYNFSAPRTITINPRRMFFQSYKKNY